MVYVAKLRIKNFKCFSNFQIDFNEHMNIIVGNNEEGKSTILEALHLVLSGMLNGRYGFSDVYESFFNKDIVAIYLNSLTTTPIPPPEILIEAYFGGDEVPLLKGINNTMREDKCGVAMKITLNESYQSAYQSLIANPTDVKSLPVEYYKIERYTFAKAPAINRQIPLKSVIIDSSSHTSQNGSDVYISKIIRDSLEEDELTSLAQSYRKLKENFGLDTAIAAINNKVTQNSGITGKNVSISVDMTMRNSWDTVLMTYINKVPFPQVGKGEQCVIKTNLALANQRAQVSNLILLEEPENHLSHTNLNILLNSIAEKCRDKQLILTTHSNYVANKLGLDNLILLSNKKKIRFNDLPNNDANYFKKLPGYDTLRLILSKAAIMVEGPSDELIVQRAFVDKYGVLPIHQGIDVISVNGLSFKRFLDIALKLEKKVAVVTDNDGSYQIHIEEKYKDYRGGCAEIFADTRDELNTLEPQFVDANETVLEELRNVIGLTSDMYPDKESIHKWMSHNKSEWALKIFEATISFNYPQYITNAIEWIHEGE